MITLGVVFIVLGVLVYAVPTLPWLGRLPGDIRIERPGMRFYFPVVSCVVVSIVLTLIFNLLSRFR